jgi:alkanesulfonate monooxygenase SsuD/methylene tetrahydromethanopterin reductase-like flavin-dependent oxidoreductase (luciferase family)
VGGTGEKRTLAIAARWADGWNAPFLSPEQFADLDDIRCAVNVGLAADEASLVQQFGGIAEIVRPGVLLGSHDQVAERVAAYQAAGADQVNLALRAPWDLAVLEQMAPAVLSGR